MDDQTLTCERVIDTLDDYLDGIDDTARPAVDAHLAGCPACRQMAADVRVLRAAARTLGPIEPPAHVWHHVRTRVAADVPARTSLLDRLALLTGAGTWRSAAQPLAAVAALALLVGSLTWIGVRLTETPTPTVAGGAGELVEFQLAEAEYTDAIDRLEEAAASGRQGLDALTSETLRASIDDIDMAIGDAREALAREPGDALSQESLLDALNSKVSLLQDTVALLGDVDAATEEPTP